MTILMLIGPPCSGKSTWAKKFIKTTHFMRVNKDEIRKMLKGDGKFNNQVELLATNLTNKMIDDCETLGCNVVLDNTHCKIKYLSTIRGLFPKAEIKIKLFDQPLWKLKLRNRIRFIKTGVWIPDDVINTMYKNFERLKFVLSYTISEYNIKFLEDE